MKVTITLKEKALEFVTGIPEEELPEILSDALEKALAQQIRPISEKSDNESYEHLVGMLQDLIKSGVNIPTPSVSSKEIPSSDFSAPKVVISKVDSSQSVDSNGIDLDDFDLLK